MCVEESSAAVGLLLSIILDFCNVRMMLTLYIIFYFTVLFNLLTGVSITGTMDESYHPAAGKGFVLYI